MKVPSDLFSGAGGILDREKAEPFIELTRSRYPWITENSMEVLLRKASGEFVRILDEETCGRALSGDLASKGRNEEALAHLKRHLEKNPENGDTWYALGDLLCKMGRTEEGYQAYARGRKLF